jgi:hypothetical protein
MDKQIIINYNLKNRDKNIDEIVFESDNRKYSSIIPNNAYALHTSIYNHVFSYYYRNKENGGIGGNMMSVEGKIVYDSFIDYCDKHFERIK